MRITSFFMLTALLQQPPSTAPKRGNPVGPYWVKWGCITACAVGLVATLATAATNNRFVDVLDTPARISPLAARSVLFAVTKGSEAKVVAVGPRGHILRSVDHGRSWVQSAVPLSSDLVAVHFSDAKNGWAVGHDGVVLASDDGGEQWRRVLDGRMLPGLVLSAYEKRAADGETGLDKFIEEAQRMKEEGSVRPFLSVYFRNTQEGWLMGQFNLLLHTADGGRSWQPWMDRTENPDGLSLHSMADVGGGLHIVGEAGLVLRLDATSGQFRRIATPISAASFFGITGNQRCVVAFGLQGTAARDCDGSSQWSRIDLPTKVAINDGVVTQDGRLLLLGQQGQLLVGKVDAGPLAALPPTQGLRVTYGMSQVEPGWLVVVGEQGSQRVALPASDSKP